jgi:hypothetical protein
MEDQVQKEDGTSTPTEPSEQKLPDNFDRLCGNGFIDTYIQYTKNQASPTLFHIWTAVAAIAGVLRRNVWISRGGYYTLYPNLYIILVAPSGKCMKSTAAAIGVKFMRKIDGLRIMHEKITPEGLISYLAGEMDKGPRKLETIMKGGNLQILAKESNCFVFAPELSVFLGGVAYTGGLIELLTSLYEGKDRWEYRTKTKGETILENVNLNMFGASNPEWLAKGLQDDAFGGGFMGRCIYIFQDVGKKVAWPRPPEGMDEIGANLSYDLLQISKMRGEFIVEPEAIKTFTEWYDAYNPDFNSRMSGYYERKPDHILKLSMILAASYSSKLEVKDRHLRQAIKMLDAVETMMPQAFAYVGATNEARVSQHILELIFGSDKHFISYRNLLNGMRHMVKHRREFDDMLDTLEMSGTIKVYATDKGRYFTVDKDVDKFREETEAIARRDAVNAYEEAKKESLADLSNQGPIKTVLEEKEEKLKEVLKEIVGVNE